MKNKVLALITTSILLLFPLVVFAVTVPWERPAAGSIRTLFPNDAVHVINRLLIGSTATTTIVGNLGTSTFNGGLEAWRQIGAPYFHATSSTASSSFANGMNISNGCYSINGSCLVDIYVPYTGARGDVQIGDAFSFRMGEMGFESGGDGSNQLRIDNTGLSVVAVLDTSKLTGSPVFRFTPWDGDFTLNASTTLVGTITGTSTATSTFAGGVQATRIGTTATSSFAGLNLLTGGLTISTLQNCSGDFVLETVNGGVVCGADAGAGAGVSGSGVTNSYTYWSDTSTLGATSSITANYIIATTTTATSTFNGILSVGSSTPYGNSMVSIGTTTQLFTADKKTGFIGIGTSTPGTRLGIGDSINLSGVAAATSTFKGGINLLSSGGCFSINGTCLNGDPVTLAGESYLSIAGQVITAADVSLATNVTGTLPIANGGTNATSFITNTLIFYNGSALISTTSQLTVNNLIASSTTATSTFLGNFSVASGTPDKNVVVGLGSTTATALVQNKNTGFWGIGTTTPGLTFGVGNSINLNGNSGATSTIQGGLNLLSSAGCFAINGTCLNGDPVTLSGENYLSIAGQVITAADVNLGSNVTGTLPIANGGTNNTSFTNNSLVWFNGTAVTSTSTGMITVSGILATSTSPNATSTFSGPVTTTATTTFSGNVGFNIASSTSQSSAYTINWLTGATQRFIVNQTTQIITNSTSSNPVDGGRYVLYICQDAGGSRSVTFMPTHIRWPSLTGTTTVASTANVCTVIWMNYWALSQRYYVLGSTTVPYQ